MVEELLGRPKIGDLEAAAAEVWRALCSAHFRRLGRPPLKEPSSGLLSCLGDSGAAACRAVLLEPEDLAAAVERRMVCAHAAAPRRRPQLPLPSFLLHARVRRPPVRRLLGAAWRPR